MERWSCTGSPRSTPSSWASGQRAGGCPTWPHIRTALAATWPMVSASFLPLLALVLTWLAGASTAAAANVGLAVAIVLLTIQCGGK